MAINIRRNVALGMACLAVFYLVASGCAWVTFRADSNAGTMPKIRAAASVKKLYFQFNACPKGKGGQECHLWQKAITDRAISMGYVLVDSSQESDLSVSLRGRKITKMDGTFMLVLFVIPTFNDLMGTDPLTKVKGLQVKASFVCAGKKNTKVYRAYSDDFLARAVMDDIRLISGFSKEQGNGTRSF